jgi:peptidoglycan/LPS O-acetylase OafA/YrhL
MHRAATAPTRMAYLDGLRGVAILSVLGFHYFTCFQSVVPYGSAWADFPLFRWGHLGVQLFFAISGFVIAMTLERCTSLAEFAVRRVARLWPTLLLCSVLSYATLSLLPSPWTPKPADFLPSLSFIDPFVWNKLIPGLDAGWIDIAYWSLFVEVRFYALAALLWFASPRRFAPMFFGLATAIVGLYALLHAAGPGPRAEWLQWAFAAKFLPWFVVGIAARLAALGRGRLGALGLGLAALQTAFLLAIDDPQAHPVALLAVTALMFGPLVSPRLARWLGARPLAFVGAASYSLYLLHQYAGLAVVSALSRAAGLEGRAALPVALAVTAGCVCLAVTIYRYWECPINDLMARGFAARRQDWAARRTALARAKPRVIISRGLQ